MLISNRVEGIFILKNKGMSEPYSYTSETGKWLGEKP
jgi:hypothetical protein